MGTRWLVEGAVDPRWPIYTRGNIGEVFPDVVTQIGYHTILVPAEAGWRDMLVEIGAAVAGDFSTDEPVIINVLAGRGYLSLSYLRAIGVRTPRSTAQSADMAILGDGEAPPYRAREGDKNAMATVKILRAALAGLRTRELPTAVADSFARTAEFEEMRPELDASDEELLDYIAAFPQHFRPVFANHMHTTTMATMVTGVLVDAATASDQAGLVTDLLGASGEVMSARYSQDLADIAEIARKSPAVMGAFDTGIDGLIGRLDGVDEAAPFRNAFRRFINEHGHRGPNDWEPTARVWENTPELALAAIDVMRRAGRELSPATRLKEDDTRRAAAADQVRSRLGWVERRNFDHALEAVPHWSRAREATRDRCVRMGLPIKQVFGELVRRGAERGGVSNPVHVGLLNPFDELAQYLVNPAAMSSMIEERAELHARYSKVKPPFFISSQDEVPTIEELEATRTSPPPAAQAGDVLRGDPGSSGSAKGRARVITDPAQGAQLQAGEILVAPITDPAWTPLFLPAAAVVVEVGALMSHAVIVARELAIPAAISVPEATARIQTGMVIAVDGNTGEVTILEGD